MCRGGLAGEGGGGLSGECVGVGGGGGELQKMQFCQRKPDDPGQGLDDPGASG